MLKTKYAQNQNMSTERLWSEYSLSQIIYWDLIAIAKQEEVEFLKAN